VKIKVELTKRKKKTKEKRTTEKLDFLCFYAIFQLKQNGQIN